MPFVAPGSPFYVFRPIRPPGRSGPRFGARAVAAAIVLALAVGAPGSAWASGSVAAAPEPDAIETSADAAAPEGDPTEVPEDEEQTDKQKADALSDEAVAKFGAKDYDGAVALFEQAYELDPQANYLFNIGRVYEEKGDLAGSVEYYERFVQAEGVDLESRQIATERLKVLRDALEQLEKDEEPEPQPQPVAPTEPVAQPDEPIADDGPTDRKKKLRIAGYSLMGVGGAALIVGGVFGGLAVGSTNDADSAEFVDDALRKRDDAKTQAAVADAMFITGGVLAATGLVLVLSTLGGRKGGDSARHRRRGERRTAWAPIAGRNGAGLSLSGRF